MTQLNYFFPTNIAPIPLNLDDAEKYDNAVIIQTLIGTLVSYSNQGKYEPCLAESWKQVDPTTWKFTLRSGFKCDNGELINPTSFKKSLEISILHIAKSSEVPIFSKTIGYESFVSKKFSEISGIEADANSLTFKFTEPLKSGLVEVLSWAPFGFICSDNRTTDGVWLDENKFISSGPYRIIEHKPGFRHTIERRSEWPFWCSNPPDRVQFAFKKEDFENPEGPTIIDTSRPSLEAPAGFTRYELYPTFIAPVLLSHESQGGFFKEAANRNRFRKEFEKVRAELPARDNNFVRATYFYDDFPPKKKELPKVFESTRNPSYALSIGGVEPVDKNTRAFRTWQTLKVVLDNLGWSYRFDSATKKMYEGMDNHLHDIRMQGWAVDAFPEAWGLDILFLSPKLGPVFPDPSGRVRKAVHDYNLGTISQEEFSDQFTQSVYEDMAIFPLWRYSVVLFASEGIDLKSISPMLSVMRFHYLEVPK